MHAASTHRNPAGGGVRLDAVLLLLLFLSAGAGVIAFGAVRIYEIGPLAALVFLALALYGARLATGRTEEGPVVPPALVPMLLFLLYAGIMLFFSTPAYPARMKFLMLSTGPVAYLLWTDVAARGARARGWLVALLAVAVLVGAYAVRQHLEGSRQVLHLVRPEGYGMRASGTYACPNHFAHLLAVALCAGAALALTPGAGRAVRIAGAVAALAPLYPLFLSRSRSGILGWGAGIAVMALLAAARRGVKRVVVALVAVTAGLGAAGWALLTFSPIWRQRFGEAVAGLHNGLDFRPICWKATIEMIRLRPAWGWGGGSYAWAEPAFQQYGLDRVAVHAHNEPLHMAMEYGLVGFGLIAVAAVVWLVRAAVLARRTSDPVAAGVTIGAVGAVVASFVHALFDFNLHIYANSHAVLLAMGAAMAVHVRDGGLRRVRLSVPARRWAGAGLAAAGLALATAMALATASQYQARRGDAAQDLARTRADYERVSNLYRAALRLDPGNPFAWRELGRTRKNLADTFSDAPERERWIEESFAAYRRAKQGNPLDPAVLHGFAQLHRMRGEQDAALAYLQEIVRLQPKRPFFQRQLAYQYERMKRYEEALAVLQTVYAMGDQSGEVRVSIQRMRARIPPRPPVPPPPPSP